MKHTLAIKLCVWLMVILSVVFSFVGYATLSDDLVVAGNVSAKEPTGLYIREYNYDDQFSDNVTVTGFLGTVLTGKVSLKESNGTTLNSVTHTVTIKNNSKDTYYFDDVTYVKNHYDNTGIEYNAVVTRSPNSDDADKIMPGQTMDISVTFTFAAGANKNNADLTSTLSYNFLLEIENLKW